MESTELYSFLSDSKLVDLIEQVKISDDILDVVTLNENQHSDMLAWCLSPNEGHAQGDAIIKDFLLAAYSKRKNTNEKFFAEWTPGRIRTSSFGAAFVTREYAIKDGEKNGRLDLFLVDTQNRIIVAIENKAGDKLKKPQLSKYHTAVENEIAKRRVFEGYKFLFVVLDRNLDEYEEGELLDLGTKWALLDYTWLCDSANRARLQVARNNHAAQLLVAYCQKQTAWESPSERRLSELAVELSMSYESVVKALRDLRRQKLYEWTPDMLQGHMGELLLFRNQHRELCAHLLRAHGIAAVLHQIHLGLPTLRPEHARKYKTRLLFWSLKVEQLAAKQEDAALLPISVSVRRESNDDDSDSSKYTVRLIWCKESFNDAIVDPEALRKHFQSTFPALKKFDESRVRRIVIKRHLDAIDAAKEAIKLSIEIDELVTSRPM